MWLVETIGSSASREVGSTGSPESPAGPDSLLSCESAPTSSALSRAVSEKLQKEQLAARGTEFTGHLASGRKHDDLQLRGNVRQGFPSI